MARNRGSSGTSSPASRPFARSSASTPAKPVSQSKPQVTNVYVQRAPAAPAPAAGMGSSILGTMAGVAGGSIIGNGISHMMFGNKGDPTPAPPQDAQQMQAVSQSTTAKCNPYLEGYTKCMEVNKNNAEACAYAWDSFMQCQRP
eukprot:Tbor_TRINITY_DN4859_c0_g1::TRINITY_DN4859_c0_g1_i8::g.1322::m.1322